MLGMQLQGPNVNAKAHILQGPNVSAKAHIHHAKATSVCFSQHCVYYALVSTVCTHHVAVILINTECGGCGNLSSVDLKQTWLTLVS